MTFLEAAESVLKESGRPMKAKEIAQLAIERGWITTQGKTPDATMAACSESSFRILRTVLHEAALRKAKVRI